MPDQIYSKGIQNFAASIINGYLSFSYEVLDNFNSNTLTYDSKTQYSYFFPETAVSLNLTTNLLDSYTLLFELSYQNVQLSFAKGEYYDISNSDMLDPAGVYSLVSGALGI